MPTLAAKSDTGPPLAMRAACAVARLALVAVTLLVAFVATAFVMVPLAIFVPPLVAILGGLLAVFVLGATSSMAESWHAGRQRRVRRAVDRRPAGDRLQPDWSRAATGVRPRPHH
jgi:fatty acid desaturase